MIDETGKIDDLLHFTDVLFFDDHDDESLSTTLWGTVVVTGDTTVTESVSAPNTLRVYNAGTGAAGAGHVPSVMQFGRNTSIRSKINMVSTVNCFARIELYTSANDYVYFGARKDGTADSRVYLWHNIASAGEVTVDLDTTNTDCIAREYRIDVTEENLLFYVDDVLIYTLKDTTLDDYYIRPYAESFVNANVLDVRFDYNKVLRLDEEERLIYKQLLAMQGGSESLGTVMDVLNEDLDLGHYESSVTPINGNENNLYNESSDRVFKHVSTLIDLTNMIAGDVATVRAYKHVDSATEILIDEKSYADAQTIKGIEVESGAGIHGIRIVLLQAAAPYREFKYINIDEQV